MWEDTGKQGINGEPAEEVVLTKEEFVELPADDESSVVEARPASGGIFGDIYDFMEVVASAVCIMIFLTSFVFRTAVVQGISMNPTLETGEKLVAMINNGVFWKIKKGDIVVVNQPNAFGHSLIKRVIGEEGDTIDIDFEKGEVRVNGVLQQEDYVNTPTNLYEGVDFPQKVPEGCVFVMGDNRNNSSDSRSGGVGMIDKRYINGKAVFRYRPLNKLGFLNKKG